MNRLSASYRIIQSRRTIHKSTLNAMNIVPNEENGHPKNVQLERAVKPLPSGPLLVNVTHRVKGADGRETLENRTTAFCRCGASSNKPLCDGSHVRIGFQG